MNNWIFISNFYNHHQKPFSDAMYNLLDGHYVFYALGEMDEERIKMGYGTITAPDYVKQINIRSNNEISNLKEEVTKADVVIAEISEAKNLLKERVSLGKITFVYSERLFKSPLRYLKAPIHFLMCHPLRRARLLCCSAFSKRDYNLLGFFKERCYKWGYFPEAYEYDDVEALISSKKKRSLLWVGRFLDWKHPEFPILAIRQLVEHGYNVQLEMIGIGALEGRMKRLVVKEGITNRVIFLGAVPPASVRKKMEECEIFLFTSDRGEGWGAVLNEAMNSCCAVVASNEIGSVPYLINDKENGVIFNSGDVDDFVEKIETILDDDIFRKKIAFAAYNSILDTWNAARAAKNIVRLVSDLKTNKDTPIVTGPCSKA